MEGMKKNRNSGTYPQFPVIEVRFVKSEGALIFYFLPTAPPKQLRFPFQKEERKIYYPQTFLIENWTCNP